jgi:hypothetical protein
MLDVALPPRPQLRGLIEAVAVAELAKGAMRPVEEAFAGRQRSAIEAVH